MTSAAVINSALVWFVLGLASLIAALMAASFVWDLFKVMWTVAGEAWAAVSDFFSAMEFGVDN